MKKYYKYLVVLILLFLPVEAFAINYPTHPMDSVFKGATALFIIIVFSLIFWAFYFVKHKKVGWKEIALPYVKFFLLSFLFYIILSFFVIILYFGLLYVIRILVNVIGLESEIFELILVPFAFLLPINPYFYLFAAGIIAIEKQTAIKIIASGLKIAKKRITNGFDHNNNRIGKIKIE